MNDSSPAPSGPALRWSPEARLRAIDEAAFWEGRVNRASLIGRFRISVPQATNDLRDYQARVPGNLRYDRQLKAYVAAEGFKPLFGAPSAEAWLGEHELTAGMRVGVIPRPVRFVDPWLLRRILEARREGMSLRILYQPMDQPEPSWRWVFPMAFGSDGQRWHLRGWNHDAGRHEDMVFPRMIELGGSRPAGDVPADAEWDHIVVVELCPAKALSASQRRVVELDYGMLDGVVRIEVRAALLFLFLWRLRLEQSDRTILLNNSEEISLVMSKYSK